ncbi:MAG TPA: DUF2225 domain-containing protein [Firmicutes bacterium]|nr:DUF2225 domain-containing protein [Bacillota bacterium]
MAVNHMRAHQRGTVLFSPGDQAVSVYFVLEGTVLAARQAESVELGPGAILGDVAFFQNRKHFYGAACLTDVRVLELTAENLESVFRTQPRLAHLLLRELAQVLPADSEKMEFLQGVADKRKDDAVPLEHLLPAGHPNFTERAPLTHNDYLFSTEVTCPICGTSFPGARMRTSRLRVQEHRPDFRTIHEDFDANLYYIWVCPHCLFAYPERQYSKISQGSVNRGQIHWRKNPGTETFVFDVQRTYQQVILSYYLALRTFEIVEATPEQWANLWLRLVWIYEDLEAEDLMEEAAENSLKYFEQAMTKTARSATGDQQLYIIMGELSLRLAKEGEAFRYFHSAATMRGGDPRYKRMAADRIQDLRKLRQSE